MPENALKTALLAFCWTLDFPASYANELSFKTVTIKAENEQPKFEKRLLVLLSQTKVDRPKRDVLANLQKGHLGNLRKMAEAGYLLVAGPTQAMQKDEAPLAGVLIFKLDGPDDQKVINQMLSQDPMIKAKLLKPLSYSFFFENGDNLYERHSRGTKNGSD